MKSKFAIRSQVILELFTKDHELKHYEELKNIITHAGDQYYAKKAIVGISPANPSAPTAVTGMKLGTGTTAAAKSGSGSALTTYLSGSNRTFNTGSPSSTDLGSGLGWRIDYAATWIAGVATHSAITEAVLVNDAASNATTSEANTYARVTFTALSKDADDQLILTWRHTFLGD